MTFFVDECVHGLIRQALRDAGHQVRTATPGTADETVLALASQAGAVLLTGDKDFGDLTIRDGKPAFSVVLYRLPGLTPSDQITRILAVIADSIGQLPGNLVLIDRERVRIRPLVAPRLVT